MSAIVCAVTGRRASRKIWMISNSLEALRIAVFPMDFPTQLTQRCQLAFPINGKIH
ncbi:hypothetical protein SZ54_0257 [Rhizobium sp. UR51a]|jgi:hypothetical protein|nr:hypothetical protein SZ54_0257 [Rhizobium sp. UR51a]